MPAYNLTQIGLDTCIQVIQWLEEGVTTRLTQAVVILLTILTVGNLLLGRFKEILCKYRGRDLPREVVLRIIVGFFFLSFPAALMLHIVFIDYALGRIMWFAIYNESDYMGGLSGATEQGFTGRDVYTTCLAAVFRSYGYLNEETMASRIIQLFDVRGFKLELVVSTLLLTLATSMLMFLLYRLEYLDGWSFGLIFIAGFLLLLSSTLPLRGGGIDHDIGGCQFSIVVGMTMVFFVLTSILGRSDSRGSMKKFLIVGKLLATLALVVGLIYTVSFNPVSCILGDTKTCASLEPYQLKLLVIPASLAACLIMVLILVLLPCRECHIRQHT